MTSWRELSVASAWSNRFAADVAVEEVPDLLSGEAVGRSLQSLADAIGNGVSHAGTEERGAEAEQRLLRSIIASKAGGRVSAKHANPRIKGSSFTPRSARHWRRFRHARSFLSVGPVY